jgi:RNA polymerase sigma-70 factor (ECF subfamily)
MTTTPRRQAVPEAGGTIVPLRPLDTRRAAVADISDDALLAACAIGDSPALGALFDRHHEAVYRLVSRLLRSEPAEIDDLVQTTFMEAWRSAGRYGGRGTVKSFLFGIAANTVRHHVRGAQRRRNAIADWQPPTTAGAQPDDLLARSQQVNRLAALDRLPTIYARLLLAIWRMWPGWTQRGCSACAPGRCGADYTTHAVRCAPRSREVRHDRRAAPRAWQAASLGSPRSGSPRCDPIVAARRGKRRRSPDRASAGSSGTAFATILGRGRA